jgi:hypothetical protein
MNLVSSLVESYMYADMYNREYSGGSNELEKFQNAGLPVDKIVPSIRENTLSRVNNADLKQDGGGKGPFANKVVPVGLVLIHMPKDKDVEYEDYLHPGMNRNIVPDSLFDILIGSVMKPERERRRVTPVKRKIVKGTRKHRN